MKIKKITDQNRRDFTAIYICENCSYEESGYGYDDANFHQNVIPDMKCRRCGKKSPDTYQPQETKYHESQVV